MPHQIKRRSLLPPATKSPSSSSSSLATTNHSSSFLEQALSHASSSFQTTVLSVLHTTAVTCLKHILSQRLHEHFQSLPPERVANTSISIVDIIDNNDTNLLVVTLEDVEICQRLAIKVGLKWSETLQKQGYVELSNIALNVTQRKGYFLEQIKPQQQPRGMEQQYDNLDKRCNREGCEQQQQNVTLDTRNDGIATLGKYTTPYATLRALRQYLLDCDGSTGLPCTLLVDYDDDVTNKNKISSSSSYADLAVREAIRKIDAFASSNLSYWDYGYDGIIEAVRRNRDRIDYSRVLHANNNTLSSSATAFDDDTGINNDDEREVEEEEEETMKGKKKRKRGRRSTVVRFRDDDDNSNDDVVARQGVKTNSGPILKSRRKMMQQQTEDVPPEEDGTGEVERCNGLLQPVTGRPPSSIGDETYKWEDILNEMSLEERQQLIISSIHPPHPFESDMTKKGTGHNNDDNDDDNGKEAHLDAIICGALKDVGKIHLWEQTRHYPPAYEGEDEEEGDDGDDEEPPAKETEGMRKIVAAATTMYGTSMTRASLKSQNRNRRQKRAMVRATKERLGRRIVSVNEHKAAYAKAVSCSKVRWTEDDDDTPFTSRQGTAGPQKWLEMDLGECTIELIDDNELIEPNNDARNSENDKKVKRLVSFRSLEVALMH